jgi:hypothetical protein
VLQLRDLLLVLPLQRLWVKQPSQHRWTVPVLQLQHLRLAGTTAPTVVGHSRPNTSRSDECPNSSWSDRCSNYSIPGWYTCSDRRWSNGRPQHLLVRRNAPTPVGQTSAPTTGSPAGTPAPTRRWSNCRPNTCWSDQCHSNRTDWCSNFGISCWYSCLNGCGSNSRPNTCWNRLVLQLQHLRAGYTRSDCCGSNSRPNTCRSDECPLQLDRLVLQLQIPRLVHPLRLLWVKQPPLLQLDRRMPLLHLHRRMRLLQLDRPRPYSHRTDQCSHASLSVSPTSGSPAVTSVPTPVHKALGFNLQVT